MNPIRYPEIDNDAGLLDSRLPFSRVTQVGELLFVSGQASIEGGAIVHGNFEEEFRRTLNNLRQILEAVGSDLNHVAQVRSYVRDEADLPLYNALYREVFHEPFPARTTITGCLPNSIRFEMECIAVVAARML